MLPDRVSNPGPLTYESGALPIALRGPAGFVAKVIIDKSFPQGACSFLQNMTHIGRYGVEAGKTW